MSDLEVQILLSPFKPVRYTPSFHQGQTLTLMELDALLEQGIKVVSLTEFLRMCDANSPSLDYYATWIKLEEV